MVFSGETKCALLYVERALSGTDNAQHLESGICLWRNGGFPASQMHAHDHSVLPYQVVFLLDMKERIYHFVKWHIRFSNSRILEKVILFAIFQESLSTHVFFHTLLWPLGEAIHRRYLRKEGFVVEKTSKARKVFIEVETTEMMPHNFQTTTTL